MAFGVIGFLGACPAAAKDRIVRCFLTFAFVIFAGANHLAIDRFRKDGDLIAAVVKAKATPDVQPIADGIRPVLSLLIPLHLFFDILVVGFIWRAKLFHGRTDEPSVQQGPAPQVPALER